MLSVPFVTPVWGGKYDFTRFTHSGLRRLLRSFDEIDSGAVSGPGTALARAYEQLLVSFSRHDASRPLLRSTARLSGFWLKYLDYFLIDRPGALDAAAGLFFLGRRRETPLADADIVEAYRGAASPRGSRPFVRRGSVAGGWIADLALACEVLPL